MPKKTGPEPSAPTTPEPPEVEETPKPVRKRAPAKPAEGKAEARQAHRERFQDPPDEQPSDTSEDTSDWSRPAYADNPGEFEFETLGDQKADEFHRVMYYGPEGTGKTINVARMTELGPGRLLIINAEGGVKRRPLAFHGVDVNRVVLYPKPGDPLTFEGLERLYYRLAADLDRDPKSWVGVAWDSVTAIYQFLLDKVIEDEITKQQTILKRANKGRAGRSGNVVLRSRFDTDRDDFATMSNQFRLLLRKYRTLACHFAVTALLRRDEEEVPGTNRKRTVYGPAVSPALQTDLLGYMDVVIRTHVEENDSIGPVYWGRTAPTANERGKDRLGGLPVEMADPEMGRVHAYLNEDLEEDEDQRQRQLQRPAVRLARRSLSGAAPVIPDSRTPGSGPDQAVDEEMGGPTEESDEAQAAPPPPAPRRSGKRSPAERAAKAEVQADSKPPTPATNRAKARASTGRRTAAPKSPPREFNDEPPF